MESFNREWLLKVILGAVFLLILLNLINSRWNSPSTELILSVNDIPKVVHLDVHQHVMVNSANVANRTEDENNVKVKSILQNCPPVPPGLGGRYKLNMTYESLFVLEKRRSNCLQPGGQYTPRECLARDRVAIIVPYRNRIQHLPIFLNNMHPFLQKQQIEYGIYLVEQSSESQFNRAMLMNIGFVEALREKNWDCMVFHDVDLLPMDDRNLYTCPDQPRHMSVAVDVFGYRLPYDTIFGGVSAMTTKQFRAINGFSNSFWGWGAEDDDLYNRLQHAGFRIIRYSPNIARYTMLYHRKEKRDPRRLQILKDGGKRFHTDGLNSLHYQLLNHTKMTLFTWIHVKIIPNASLAHIGTNKTILTSGLS
ncbi:beta-1,4-galactosyltransferase 4-like [Uranotaenia lowii]|uniref:beta-1,4-galactosyltransferase 4-like n=1 Tax=Uranotaenia lowii TaxID=190385 RepID=UPI002478A78E|nr:beta-1,4-galactosyltransferase 4-like [Uranotaenia lowii]